tara:strand:- start:1193 stop:1552 length:360 start_codon:yes stop_codon:yes gene_type:complete
MADERTWNKKKKIEEIANYIINNITMAEVTHILIEKATETATEIVDNDLPAEEYRAIIFYKNKRKKKSSKLIKDIKDGVNSFWTTVKNAVVPEKKNPLDKIIKRDGFTTKNTKKDATSD